MISESQIREKLGRYLRRDLSLDQFEDWIASQSWNMHKDSSDVAQKLASEIELRLAEHSSGHLSEASLRDELRQFANPSVVLISFGEARQAPATDQPSNNVLAEAKPQVIAFTSRHRPALADSFPGGVVSSDRGQLAGRV
ncbi:MAG TPA: hypothetical protein VIH89_14855 [Candidatus Sulfotelmatobacter sp.]